MYKNLGAILAIPIIFALSPVQANSEPRRMMPGERNCESMVNAEIQARYGQETELLSPQYKQQSATKVVGSGRLFFDEKYLGQLSFTCLLYEDENVRQVIYQGPVQPQTGAKLDNKTTLSLCGRQLTQTLVPRYGAAVQLVMLQTKITANPQGSIMMQGLGYVRNTLNASENNSKLELRCKVDAKTRKVTSVDYFNILNRDRPLD